MVAPELIKGALLLLSLTVLQSYVLRTWPKARLPGKIASGVLFGSFAIIGMVLPLTLLPGLKLETHSIIVSVGALWGGPLVGVMAALMAVGFSIFQGEAGTFTTILAVSGSAAIGLGCRLVFQRFRLSQTPLALFLFGGVVQVAAVVCMLLLPDGTPPNTIYQIAITQLLVFPPAIMILGLLLNHADHRFHEEQQLHASEARFRDLANSTGDFFFEQDPDGIVTSISPRFEEITGLTRDAIEGRHFRKLIDWDSIAPDVTEALTALSEKRPFKDVELPLRLGDSRQLWLRASALPVFSDNGTFVGFRGAATNITSRIWERNTLAERERRLNALYDNMQEGLAVYQLVRNRAGEFIDYRIIDANPAFERQTGLIRESTIGRLASLVYGTGTAPHLEKYGRVAESEQPSQFDAYFETLGRHLTISAFGLNDDLVVSVFRDVTDTVRAMEKLRASEIRFRDFADCSADWFFEQNGEGTITYLSDRFEHIVGTPKEHFLGKNFVDVIDSDESSHDCVQAIANQRPFRNLEALLKLPSGQKTWIRVSANPLFGNRGEFVGFRGTAADITAEKEIQAAIMRERDRARLYLETAGTILVVLDRDGMIQEINRKGQEILGRDRQDLIGRNWFDVAIPLEETVKIRAIHNEVMSGRLETAERIESKIVSLAGEERIIAWTNSYIQNNEGQILASISSGEDITERQQAETALAESQRQLATLMSNLPGMAYRCRIDRNWSMQFVSTGVEKLTGYRAEDIIEGGKIAYAQIIHPDDRERVWTETLDAVDNRRPFSYTYRITTADGRVRWVWEQGRAIFAVDGSPGALEGFINDISDRVEFENALRESEERFRKMFENSSDAIVLRGDASGRFEDANPAALELYGFSRDEFLKLTPLDLTAEIEATREALDRLETDGRIYLEIRRHRKKDGTTFPVELSVWTFTLGGKRKFVAAMRDISRRTVAETALRESEDRFRAILEASPSSIFLKDRNGRYVLANPAFCARVGLPLAKIIGKRTSDIRPPGAVSVSEEHDREVMETGRQKTIEAAVHEHDSQTHTYLSTKYPIRDADGHISGLACVSTDISGRIAAEAALAESEAKYRAIIETVLEGVWEIGADGETLFVNDRLVEMLGYERKEMMGRSFLEFMDDDWKEKAKKRLEMRKGGKSDRRIFKFLRKDGSDLWATVSTAPKLDASGRFLSAVALVTDMTHQHHLDAKIRELEDHLSHVSRISQAGELATSFAHQLNQPLAAAGVYAQGLLEQFSQGHVDPEEVKRVVGTINDQMRRASEAITKTRAFVRRRKATKVAIALNDVVREVADLLRTEMQHVETGIQVRLATPSPMVLGDPVLLQQILLNLAQNAVEAMIDVEPRNRRIVITTSINGRNEAVMRVRDQGPGLGKNAQKRLFETFFTTKPEGLGMGLSICQTIAESHGGKIFARNHRSGGAIFEVIIPSIRGVADG